MSQVHAVPVTGRAGAGALLAHRRNDDAVGQFEVAQRPGFKKTRHASTIARAKRLDVLNRVRHCTCGHRNKCVDSGDVTAAVRFVGAGQSFSLYSRVPTAPLIDRFVERMCVCGTAFKVLIHEVFVAGNMSAIDFHMDLRRAADPKGDRVSITMSGWFLPSEPSPPRGGQGNPGPPRHVL